MKTQLLVPLALLSLAGGSPRVLAHGAAISYQSEQAIALQAAYDSGQPMANAQVIIYAPDEPARAWQKGSTDSQGQYIFVPDRTKAGNWQVAVRQAGHGDTISIPIQPASANASDAPAAMAVASSTPETLTPLQKGIVAGSVIWGFIGTALFFSKGKR